MSSQRWFFRCWNGPEVGPLSLAQLKAAALAGELGPYDEAKEVRRADEAEWKRVPRSLAAIGENVERHRHEYEGELKAFSLFSTPCWELLQSRWVDFMPVDWPARWVECGGRFFEGRMIAPKTDEIWQRIGDSARYPDGLNYPHFPFVLSCVSNRSVPREECLRLGVMTEAEMQEQQSRAPAYDERRATAAAWRASLAPGEFERITADLHRVHEELSIQIAEGQKLIVAQKAEDARLAPEREAARQREAVEKNRAFSNVEEVRQRLPLLKEDYSPKIAAELLTRLTEAVGSGHFQRYPKWLALSYRFTGEILELLGELQQAVEYYGLALKVDPKVGVAQRVKALRAKLGSANKA